MENNIKYYKARCGCLIGYNETERILRCHMQCRYHKDAKNKVATKVSKEHCFEDYITQSIEEISKIEATIMILGQSNEKQ